MKKIEYIAPEIEILEMTMDSSLLTVSDGTEPAYGGEGNPEVNIPD